MKYKINSSSDFRHAIYELGYNQSSLARVMQSLGDKRGQDIIARNFRNMLSGKTKVSDEIVVVLNLLAQLKELNALPTDPKKAGS